MGASVLDASASMMIYFLLITFFPIVKRFWKKAFVPKKTEKFFIKLTMDAVKMRDTGMHQRDDFINYVLSLRNKKGISDIDIAAHAMTFFLDGVETSSIGLSFTLYYLGKNRKIQNKLRKEIQDNVGDDGTLTFDKIMELPYLDQVLNGKLILRCFGSLTSVYFRTFLRGITNRSTSWSNDQSLQNDDHIK